MKDQIFLKGTLSTFGVASRANCRKNTDATSVALLREQGGIPFVKGNVAEACFSINTDNRIWGQGKNPHDQERTVGGSSGGDAGMLASGCTPFSLGTDFGGSIRIPALFCGCTAFCGTPERHSIQGLSCYTKHNGVHSRIFHPVIGPMGRCVDDIVDGMKSLSTKNVRDYDKAIPSVPFKQDLYDHTMKKKLKIGIIENIDEICTLQKDSLNAFEDAKEALTKAGHEIVSVKIENLHGFAVLIKCNISRYLH